MNKKAIIEIIDNGQVLHANHKKMYHEETSGTALKIGQICADAIAEHLGDECTAGQKYQILITMVKLAAKEPKIIIPPYGKKSSGK